MMSKLVQTNRITVGGQGPQQPLNNSSNFWKKNSHFKALWIAFRTFVDPFKRSQFLDLVPAENLSRPAPSAPSPLRIGQVQNSLNANG